MDAKRNPLIFDIARGSLADGDGIRTVVFLKGCPLQCIWCHNPESQNVGVEHLRYPERCIKCGNCSTGCNSNAMVTVGKYYSPGELTEIVLRDKIYYETSKGGVTFSGGEPLLYIDYIASIAREIKKHDINILIETAGHFDFSQFERVLLPYVDTVFFDLKIFNEELHKKYTGHSNRLILDNFKRIIQTKIKVIPRIPLVPEVVSNEKNLEQIADFLNECSIEEYELLSYNSSCIDKQKRLGLENPYPFLEKPMTSNEENQWKNKFIEHKKRAALQDFSCTDSR